MVNSADNPELFRIGAVSRLTGIPVDTLRVWERRYAVVQPQRSEGGNRLYSRDDVERLQLIRQLVNRSHAIGTVCNLSKDQLQDRLAVSLRSDGELLSALPDPAPALPVVLVGGTLGIKLRSAVSPILEDAIEIAAEHADLASLRCSDAAASARAIVVEVDTLRDAEVEQLLAVRETHPEPVLAVVYGFASKTAVERLTGADVLVDRHPVDWTALMKFIRARAGLEAGAADGAASRPPPSRLFSDRQLAALSGMSVTLKCECPHHLSELIGNLARFEKYSAQCEHDSEDDAELHNYLHDRTAQARLIMERALYRVVQREGLKVPDDE